MEAMVAGDLHVVALLFYDGGPLTFREDHGHGHQGHGEGGEDGNQAATDDALFSHGLFSCVMVVIMRRRSSPVNSLRKVIVMSSSL